MSSKKFREPPIEPEKPRRFASEQVVVHLYGGMSLNELLEELKEAGADLNVVTFGDAGEGLAAYTRTKQIENPNFKEKMKVFKAAWFQYQKDYFGWRQERQKLQLAEDQANFTDAELEKTFNRYFAKDLKNE